MGRRRKLSVEERAARFTPAEPLKLTPAEVQRGFANVIRRMTGRRYTEFKNALAQAGKLHPPK